ncbi:MAG TPA: hypothetical protein VFA45_06705 [Actinomycetes bacterium]|jgi:hypothetical protein|nr:hypothetical protein [Actinomycetes bacterium]
MGDATTRENRRRTERLQGGAASAARPVEGTAGQDAGHRPLGELGLVTLASGPIIAAELVEGVNGLLQRAAMWTPLAWMMAVSIKLSALAPRSASASSKRTDRSTE